MNKNNIIALIKKELLIILKDPRSRAILIVPVIMQTLLFGYVATYDITKVYYAVLDEDKSAGSRELIAKFDATGIFKRKYEIQSIQEIAPLIDNKKVSTVLYIDKNFSKNIDTGGTPSVQIILDSRNSNMAGIISGYSSEIIQNYINPDLGIPIHTRTWYNPNAETRWTMVTGIIAALALIQITMLTALSVAREREKGTFDQLLVTPLSSNEILIGKAVPSVIIGLMQASTVFFIARFWFKIPFGGSYILFYSGLLLFLAVVVGIGLLVSSIADNMQQGMLYSFILINPVILLSGYVTPVKTMPYLMQQITLINPLRHALLFIRRVYLEGAGIDAVYKELIILFCLAAILLPFASKMFRKNVQ